MLLSLSVAAQSVPPPPLPPMPPPAIPGVGPQATIACPTAAVDIWPGTSIPLVVSLHDGLTTFCLRAGVHYLDRSITPKTGNTYVGEYGAILDGTGWTTIDDTEAAFRANNQDIDDVTIRNLVIRSLRRGIHAFGPTASRWTIENNDIHSNYSGVIFPSDSIIRNNYIHNNPYSGYMGMYAHNSLLENNEISYNGWEQKVTESDNVTFRNNFVHHNTGAGIWYDSNNTGALVEGNLVEDNGHAGIWYEIGAGVIVRNNTIRRSADTGVFISTSKNAQIHNNTLEENFRGITFFVNCEALGGGVVDFDLANNSAFDNTITVGTQIDALANVLSYTLCTSAQLAPYMAGSKSLIFSRNTYHVPALNTGRYWWLWSGGNLWGQWQSRGNDVDGVAQ